MKKSLSVLILSFLLFGSATTNSNDRMELRSVLDNNIANTDSGKAVRTKRANDVTTKEVANEVKVQQRRNDNGTYDVRFVAGISSLELSKTVFNVSINNGTKTANKSYDVTKAYTHIMVNEDTLSATDVFGEGYDYLVAYAITGIPESAITYTYSVNVSINDDNGVLNTSNTKTLVLKEIIEKDEEKLPDLSDKIIKYNDFTTVTTDNSVSHDGVQSIKIEGVNASINQYTQARYDFETPISADNLNISFYVKLDGAKVRSNRIIVRVAPTKGDTVDPNIYLTNNTVKGVTVSTADENGWYKITLDCNTLEYDGKTLSTGATLDFLRFSFEPQDKDTAKVIEPIIWIDELTYSYSGNGNIEVTQSDLSDKITHSNNTTISLDTEVSHDGVQSAKITGTPATGKEDYSLAFYYGSATLTETTKISFYAKLGEGLYNDRVAFRIYTKEGAKLTNNIKVTTTNPISGVTCTPDVNGWYHVVVDVASFKDNDSTLTAVGGTLEYLRFGIIGTDRESGNATIVPIAWIDELYIY